VIANNVCDDIKFIGKKVIATQKLNTQHYARLQTLLELLYAVVWV
jgi:hypothetical protein